jgi:hypothetical protein
MTKTYGQHLNAVARAQTAFDAVYDRMTSYAIAGGDGMVRPSELRKRLEYRIYFADIDAAELVLMVAKDAAVDDYCAHRQGSYGDRFEWYAEKDARKFRRDAKKRT